MVHTGQHYDDELSKIFFEQLSIRQPDFTLSAGESSSNQYEQLSYLSREVPNLLKREKIKPKIILFLGDSHSAVVSVPLFKEGYKIGHIEGGMRSYDRRMPEEVNRVICDYVSDYIFVYTPLYRERLLAENKSPDSIYVVGNTIVEVVREYCPDGARHKDYILADIHRNENLKSRDQYLHILQYLNNLGEYSNLPVQLVKFNRALRLVNQEELQEKFTNIKLVGPFGFIKYLEMQYHAFGVVSDSGTSQEECPLLGVPVVVPRNYTERPESVDNGNSILIGETRAINDMVDESIRFFEGYVISEKQLKWLGDGRTSKQIVDILTKKLG